MISPSTAKPGPESTATALLHWEQADDGFLKKGWFYGKLEKLVSLIRAQGRKAGAASNVQFYISPWRAAHNGPETIALISAEGASVPFLVPLEPAWKDEFTFKSFSEHLVGRTQEIIASRTVLGDRLAAIVRAAGEATEALGHGAAVHEIFYEPTRFDEPCVHSQQPSFKAAIGMIADDLGELVEGFTVSLPSELKHQVAMFAGQQSYRAEAINRRRANSGKIEIDRIALHLLRLTDLKIEDVASVANGYALPWDEGLNVEGAELTRLSFFLSAGRVTTNFYFEGGYYHSGSVYLFDDIPESVQHAAIGRPINEVVSGGIFNIVSPKIVGLGSMNAGTQFRLEKLTDWIDCHLDENVRDAD